MAEQAANPILTQYEELLYFRLMKDDDLLIEDMLELLEAWYQLRRSLEAPPAVQLKIEPVGKPAPRQKKTQKAPEKPKAENKAAFFGPYAALKRDTLEKLEKVRAAGVSTAYIVKAAGGTLTIGELQQILAREKVPIEAWQALASTLKGLEVPKKEET